MNKYKVINENNLNGNVDNLYNELLSNNYPFLIIISNGKKYVLTKEKSLIQIDNEKEFIDKYNKDIFYKTIVLNEEENINKEDLDLYFKYINKYKKQITKVKYNNKYYYGCISVKTKNGFITTIRGKENLDDYVLVKSVDHNKHIIYTVNRKAALNAPLFDYIFKNNNVKVIVQLHATYDKDLDTYEYAFPGTVRDSIRNNTTSFNIMHHGTLYLFNKKGERL